jgi:hypothetical protein
VKNIRLSLTIVSGIKGLLSLVLSQIYCTQQQMRTLILLSLACFTLLAYGAQVCRTENFDSFGCNFSLPNGVSIFDGTATLALTVGTNLIGTYVPNDENCELSFGACTTLSGLDTTHPIAATTDAGSQVTITFSQLYRTFTLGKLYSSSITYIQFIKNGNVVLSDSIDRTNANCLIGSSRTWSVLGGYDKIVINGNQFFGITELSACYYGATLFTGGVGGYVSMPENECTHCVDALRINYWKKYTCSDTGVCKTRTYLGSGCTSINFAINTLNISINFLQLVFPVPNTVCVVTGQVPPSAQAREIGSGNEEL